MSILTFLKECPARFMTVLNSVPSTEFSTDPSVTVTGSLAQVFFDDLNFKKANVIHDSNKKAKERRQYASHNYLMKNIFLPV